MPPKNKPCDSLKNALERILLLPVPQPFPEDDDPLFDGLSDEALQKICKGLLEPSHLLEPFNLFEHSDLLELSKRFPPKKIIDNQALSHFTTILGLLLGSKELTPQQRAKRQAIVAAFFAHYTAALTDQVIAESKCVAESSANVLVTNLAAWPKRRDQLRAVFDLIQIVDPKHAAQQCAAFDAHLADVQLAFCAAAPKLLNNDDALALLKGEDFFAGLTEAQLQKIAGQFLEGPSNNWSASNDVYQLSAPQLEKIHNLMSGSLSPTAARQAIVKRFFSRYTKYLHRKLAAFKEHLLYIKSSDLPVILNGWSQQRKRIQAISDVVAEVEPGPGHGPAQFDAFEQKLKKIDHVLRVRACGQLGEKEANQCFRLQNPLRPIWSEMQGYLSNELKAVVEDISNISDVTTSEHFSAQWREKRGSILTIFNSYSHKDGDDKKFAKQMTKVELALLNQLSTILPAEAYERACLSFFSAYENPANPPFQQQIVLCALKNARKKGLFGWLAEKITWLPQKWRFKALLFSPANVIFLLKQTFTIEEKGAVEMLKSSLIRAAFMQALREQPAESLSALQSQIAKAPPSPLPSAEKALEALNSSPAPAPSTKPIFVLPPNYDSQANSRLQPLLKQLTDLDGEIDDKHERRSVEEARQRLFSIMIRLEQGIEVITNSNPKTQNETVEAAQKAIRMGLDEFPDRFDDARLEKTSKGPAEAKDWSSVNPIIDDAVKCLDISSLAQLERIMKDDSRSGPASVPWLLDKVAKQKAVKEAEANRLQAEAEQLRIDTPISTEVLSGVKRQLAPLQNSYENSFPIDQKYARPSPHLIAEIAKIFLKKPAEFVALVEPWSGAEQLKSYLVNGCLRWWSFSGWVLSFKDQNDLRGKVGVALQDPVVEVSAEKPSVPPSVLQQPVSAGSISSELSYPLPLSVEFPGSVSMLAVSSQEMKETSTLPGLFGTLRVKTNSLWHGKHRRSQSANTIPSAPADADDGAPIAPSDLACSLKPFSLLSSAGPSIFNPTGTPREEGLAQSSLERSSLPLPLPPSV